MDEKHEECGVFGVHINVQEAAGLTYNALSALQHRGQEGAGIAVLSRNAIVCRKNMGLVSEAFAGGVLDELPSSGIGVGHVRYSTTGGNVRANLQPVAAEFLWGRIAVVHNGNIVNAGELKQMLAQYGCSFAATTDSEVISALIAYEIVRNKDLQTAVTAAVRQLRGAFSLIVLSSDEHGYAFASESCALDSAGFRFVRDIEPGEMAVVGPNGDFSCREILEKDNRGLCIFEYVYFARPDSVIDGLSVYQARYNMGAQLAREYPVDADLVCGVPDSGLDAAIGYAAESGLPNVPGFVKNRYIGRSFIFPSQSQRDAAVRLKLNLWAPTCRANGWCWWTIPSSGALPAPRSSECSNRQAPARSMCGYPPLPLPTPAILAQISTVRKTSWPTECPWRKFAALSARTVWAISASKG